MARLGRGLLVGLALFTASCPSSDDIFSNFLTRARFAPSSGEIPMPNDLFFGESMDATLNIPITDPAITSDPFIALNTLDGWSPVAPANVTFTANLDPTTVIPGDTVRMFEVTAAITSEFPVGGPVTAIERELIPNVDFEAVVTNNSNVAIQPLLPLTPSTAADPSVYLVVLTNGIRDTRDRSVTPDAEYLTASDETPLPPATTPPELLSLQTLINAQLTNFAGEANAVREDVVVSFTYTVQSIGTALGTVRAIAQGGEAAVIAELCGALGTCGSDTAVDPLSTAILRVSNGASSIGTASELVGGPVGLADIFMGVLEAPYYLTEADNTAAAFDGLTSDTAPLRVSWMPRYETDVDALGSQLSRFNTLPVATSSQRMPVLISVPRSAMPAGGFPIVIFQHGIGSDRSSLLGIAESLAAAGLAAVAIDLPLHGLNPTTGMLPNGVSIFTGFPQETAMGGATDVWERSFGLDLLAEPAGGSTTAGPDGIPDSSGAHFINLNNLAVSRDNLRQGVADLLNLAESLGSLTVMGMDIFDESEVHFIGHSLGGIVGTPFLALQPGITAATLGMPGASFPFLLNGSTILGPVVESALADQGISPGTPAFAQFLAAAQSVVDSADPINYANTIAAGNLPLLLIEVIGGGPGGGVSDLVIPNSVLGAPLAGTEPLIAALDLDPITGDVTDAAGVQGAIRFVEGNHSSLVSPDSTPGDAAVFAEIQTIIRSFHVSGGQNVTVADTALIEQ